MDLPSSFGYWVRRRRKALDLTQADLARRVGCAEVTIQKIEADERRPSSQIAALLAEHLRIPPAERATFLQRARGELAADPLPASTPDGRPMATPPALAATDAPAGRPPSGTVTFLFTDIEGSSQLWEQHPQAMPAALARHETILRQPIAAHGGVIVKTTGDGVHAAFARTTDAVTAALVAQRALHSADWGAIGALRVRMALHTGVAEERDGDYYGPPLNRATRLMAAAHGGQVLLSRATAELVREQLPPDTALHDLGTHRLKDLSLPEQIFQLLAPDLPAIFPPLNTLDARRTNLPIQPTPLIGRENEVAAVATLLRGRNVRLLTLTGPGGVGKTRLALQTAVELLDEFVDGVYLVNLAPIADPDLVSNVIAQTLELREAAGRPLLDQLHDYLHDKHLLLLLDNFEQVISAAAMVADLLAACPLLTILVTSRETLHVRGEKGLPVPPLALPDLKRLPPLAALAQYAAVELFIARAQDVRHDFALTDKSAPTVAAICDRLDGLPLAIELAAARIKLLAPQALLEQLGDRLTLLTGGARDLPARQQTLRDTIDWSYHLLDVSEQLLFERLGVFVGGCALEAAAAVCNVDADLPIDVLDGLAALLDKSLLKQIEGADGEPRFVMLETIREYALERLVASGEEAAVRQRHAWYYLTLAERAEPLLQGAEQLAWLDRLEADYENLRAVLAWSQVAGDGAVVGLRIVATLWPFWELGGYLSEAQEQGTRMLAHPEAAAPTVARARALFTVGYLIGSQGDFALARAHLTESDTCSRTIGYQPGVAYARLGLGYVAWLAGEYATARTLLAESLTLFRELGARWPIALATHALASAELYLDNYDRAVPLLDESLQLFRALGDQFWYSHVLLQQGYAARLQGDNGRAAASYAESLALFQDLGNKWGIAAVQLALGYLALAQGDAPQAAACFTESLVRYRELGHQEGISICLAGSAGAAGSLGQPVRAARLFGAADGLRARIGARGQPMERATHEQSVARVRAQLDSATFAAAWAEGRAMTLEQAIDIALDEEN